MRIRKIPIRFFSSSEKAHKWMPQAPTIKHKKHVWSIQRIIHTCTKIVCKIRVVCLLQGGASFLLFPNQFVQFLGSI